MEHYGEEELCEETTEHHDTVVVPVDVADYDVLHHRSELGDADRDDL